MASRAESEEKKVIDPNSDEVSETAAKHIIEYVACSHFKAKNALMCWSAKKVARQDSGVDSCYVFFFFFLLLLASALAGVCLLLANICTMYSRVQKSRCENASICTFPIL